MKLTFIYQTLENRNNKAEVEKHGPYFCSLIDSQGNQKQGVKEPWLGEGFYFWDTRIEDAKWWGDTVFKNIGKGYYICEAQYDAHSEKLFDMVGDLSAFDEFIEVAKELKRERKLAKVSFPYVLSHLKNIPEFDYAAIRVCPISKNNNFHLIYFPFKKGGENIYLGLIDKVQICFFDHTLLTQNFKVVEETSCMLPVL